jgi:hypothetical protein
LVSIQWGNRKQDKIWRTFNVLLFRKNPGIIRSQKVKDRIFTCNFERRIC